MQLGQDDTGMMTLNQNLHRLVLAQEITTAEALKHSPDPEEFTKLLDKKSAGWRKAS
jgi:Tfp pilus assembly pilus retraction ATPase PilT